MDDSATAAAIEKPFSCARCGAPVNLDSQLCEKCVAAGSKPLSSPSDSSPVTAAASVEKARLLKRLHRHERSFTHWSHTAANVTQVIALFVVGFWTMHTFSRSEEPSLQPHVATGLDITWKRMPGATGTCEADVSLTVENSGKQAVRITKMTLRAWLTATPKRKPPFFIADEELSQGKPFFEQEFSEGKDKGVYLLGELAPGSKVQESFLFDFKNSPGERVVWDAIYETDPPMSRRAWDSDFVCNFKP